MPSSHQPFPATTLLLNLNEIIFSHTRQPEFDPQSRLISVPLVTTHLSRTSHDFKVCWGPQPSLHGKGQKNAWKLLME